MQANFEAAPGYIPVVSFHFADQDRPAVAKLKDIPERHGIGITHKVLLSCRFDCNCHSLK